MLVGLLHTLYGVFQTRIAAWIAAGKGAHLGDPCLHALVGRAAAELFGEERFAWMANPEAGAEDMSYVLERVPGAFVNLGACPPGLDPMTAPLNHAAQAHYDDAVVPDGAVLLAELAWRRMSR